LCSQPRLDIGVRERRGRRFVDPHGIADDGRAYAVFGGRRAPVVAERDVGERAWDRVRERVAIEHDSSDLGCSKDGAAGIE
jgi:hypothetical protein